MPISEIDVSINQTDEDNLQAKGFTMTNVNLNKGGGGNRIFLWYKEDSGLCAITRIQVSFNDEMADGLRRAGFTRVERNLNAGSVTRGSLYLWYFRGEGENHSPIERINVTTDPDNEASKFKFGYERVSCDLNRGPTGDWIHIWLKRKQKTYITEVFATDSYGSDADLFEEGYIRVDENTNRGVAGVDPVFIWYLPSTNKEGAITDLAVSTTNNDFEHYQAVGYQSVNVNLNEGTGGSKVTLWFKRGGGAPIQILTLLLNQALMKDYLKAGLNVIERNLNQGNSGFPEFLCFK